MCTYPVQPICTFSCTSVFFINIYYPQYTVLHILSHCTSYTFILLFVPFFILTYIYIYILLCLFILLLMLFYFYFYFYFFFFCTFHWAELSRPTFHYWLYPVWLCMWQIIKNLEPWTLNPGIKARAVKPASATGMQPALAGMPEVWHWDAVSHSLKEPGLHT